MAQQLRVAAQVDGVDATYRPLLLASLGWEFTEADPATQRELHDTATSLPAADTLAAVAVVAGVATAGLTTPLSYRASAA